MTLPELLQIIPSEIKVGTLTYKIEVVFGLLDEEGKEVSGICVFETQTIKIDGVAPSKAWVVDTLLHELLHAVWNERGLPKKANEERAVKTLGTGLLGLFQDNPKLLTWIKKGLR
jgi:hypothetical protein